MLQGHGVARFRFVNGRCHLIATLRNFFTVIKFFFLLKRKMKIVRQHPESNLELLELLVC